MKPTDDTNTIYEEIRKSAYGGSPNNVFITRRGRTLELRHTYPEITEFGIKYFEIDQESVRASDGIRLHYDYDRDGWIIEQPTKLCWSSTDTECDMGWKEVAFIQSWALEEEQKAHEESL